MAVIKRDVVLMGKDSDGDTTIDMPITRLGNIEDDAEIKAAPTTDDFIPIIDMADGGQMKKTPYVVPEGGENAGTGNIKVETLNLKPNTTTNYGTATVAYANGEILSLVLHIQNPINLKSIYYTGSTIGGRVELYIDLTESINPFTYTTPGSAYIDPTGVSTNQVLTPDGAIQYSVSVTTSASKRIKVHASYVNSYGNKYSNTLAVSGNIKLI